MSTTRLPAVESRSIWSEWALASAIALVALLAATGVWSYTHWAERQARLAAGPAWQTVPNVLSQLADGRMVRVKVNLQLERREDMEALRGHEPAFAATIQSVGTGLTHRDLKGEDGLDRYGHAIREAVNEYLADRRMDERVRRVAFEEFVLMP